MLAIREFLKLRKVGNVNTLPQVSTYTYNYLIGVAMLYMMLSILSGLTVYKLVLLGSFLVPAGIFTTPLTYCLGNVTTEVYGYQIARNLMWWFVFTSTLFTGLATLLVNLPSPLTFEHQSAYDLILGSMPRVYCAGIAGTVLGMHTNNYLVSKIKIKMKGKHYWFRSILSTCSGEILYNMIAYPIMLLWRVPLETLFHIFISVTIFKILTTAVFLAPECFLAGYLKKKEKINVFDYNVNYNLFKFKVRDEIRKKVPLKLVKK